MPVFLSQQQERELLTRWVEQKDYRARDRIIASHAPLVEATVRRMKRSGAINDDLRQEGMLGLLIAVNRFDLSKDVRFATFAKWWVHAQMSDFVFRQASDVRGSTSSEGKKLTRSGACRISTVSLDTPLSDDSEATFRDTFVSEEPSPEDVAVQSDGVAAVRAAFGRAMRGKPQRTKVIAALRMLSDDPPTLRELGHRLGISQERVRQIESKAKAALRAELADA
jgi:RNA polymerase sigma factor (sigma-70 family)